MALGIRSSMSMAGRSRQKIIGYCLTLFLTVLISGVYSQPLECPHFYNAPCVNETRTNQSLTCRPDLSYVSNNTCVDDEVCIISIYVSSHSGVPVLVSSHCNIFNTDCKSVRSECVFKPAAIFRFGSSHICCCNTSTCVSSELTVDLTVSAVVPNAGSTAYGYTTSLVNMNSTAIASSIPPSAHLMVVAGLLMNAIF